MSFEELEGYRNRLNDIMKCTDKKLKKERLITLQADLKETYNVPAIYDESYHNANPEVFNVYLEVVEEIANIVVGRLD